MAPENLRAEAPCQWVPRLASMRPGHMAPENVPKVMTLKVPLVLQ